MQFNNKPMRHNREVFGYGSWFYKQYETSNSKYHIAHHDNNKCYLCGCMKDVALELKVNNNSNNMYSRRWTNVVKRNDHWMLFL